MTIFLWVPICLSAADKKFTIPPSDRQKINLDTGWRFFRGDINGEEETHQVNQRPWQDVQLPHEWSIEGPFDRAHNTTQGFLPMEIGWYRNGLRFPEHFGDKKLYLIFDGVYRESDVWMNYAFLGHHQSGYTSFDFDISDYVRCGNRTPNSLRVRIDARRHEQDMYEGCGIYRHVWIVVTNKVHVDNWGTFVHASNISNNSATINIQTKIKNSWETARNVLLTTVIVDKDNNIVREIKEYQNIPAQDSLTVFQSSQINHPHLWDINNPHMYKAFSVLKIKDDIVDVYETPFGIRNTRFDSDEGFFLNDRHVKLIGFNAHYDFAGLGTAIPDRIHFNLMTIMKKAGFNFYRSSHNPATPERLDVCDNMGLLVWDEAERKLESVETELPLVRDTIIRDRNHPGIILWSLENESPLESTVFGTKIITAGHNLAHKLDPTRFTTFAASMPVNKKGYGEAVDVVSYNYHIERADEDHLNFPHWNIGLISEYSAARGRRGVYGLEKFARAEEDNYFDLYNGEIQTMYQMCDRIEGYWRRIKARDYIAGGAIWSGLDSWGEGNTWPLISRGDGLLDMCFFPKDAYYYFVSQYTSGPMVYIFPHWNWAGKEGQNVDVWAYSNCEKVELFLNEKSLGVKNKPVDPIKWTPDQPQEFKNSEKEKEHFEWRVPYQPGILKAVGYKDGEKKCETIIKTTGTASQIRLSKSMEEFLSPSEIPPFIADGRDIVVIKAEITDKNGLTVPTANNMLEFSCDNDAKIIGVGNGNIVSHEANKSTNRTAYNGLAVVIIQTKTPGKIKISAQSKGLKTGEFTVAALPPVSKKLALSPTPCSIKSGESSIVEIAIQDKFATINPVAQNSVNILIDGPGVFENKTDSATVEIKNGIYKINILNTDKKGRIKVTAYSENLIPALCHIQVN